MFSMCGPRITNLSAPKGWGNNINVNSGQVLDHRKCSGL